MPDTHHTGDTTALGYRELDYLQSQPSPTRIVVGSGRVHELAEGGWRYVPPGDTVHVPKFDTFEDVPRRPCFRRKRAY